MKSILLTLVALALIGCGEVPKQTRTDAQTGSRSSNGSKAGTTVFCSNCGVIPGNPSKCPNHVGHHFVEISGGGKIICKNCGGTPAANPYVCSGFTSHAFTRMGK